MIVPRAALSLLLLVVPAAAEEAPPAPAPAPAEEPPAAVVHGKPIPRRDAFEELARRRFRGEDGDRMLEQFAGEIVVRAEQARRGVVVPEEEVLARVEDARRRLADRMARAGRKVGDEDPLEKLLKESGNSMAAFLEETRYFLALERMAREDLGVPGEVSEAQAQLWVRDLVRRRNVVTDPAALGPGAIARVGEESIPLAKAGAWLARRVRTGDLLAVVHDLAFGVIVETRAAEAKVAAGEEEIAAEYARIAREFEREPGIEGTGVTFERWLKDRQGLSPAEYRASAPFRTRVLARKVVAAGISDEAVRLAWEEDPDLWGETARVRRILIRGEDKAGVFGAAARPMAEARTIADRALAEVVAGRPFETVARKYSEDAPREEARGQPLDVTPKPKHFLLPETVLEAIFKAKVGETIGPIRAIDGWHLVRIERRAAAPSFEECRDRVREFLVAAGVRKWRGTVKDDPAVVVAKDL